MSNKLTDNSFSGYVHSTFTSTKEDFMLQLLVSISVLHQQLHSTCTADPWYKAFKTQSPTVHYSRRIPLKPTVHKLKVYTRPVMRSQVNTDALHTVSATHTEKRRRAPTPLLSLPCFDSAWASELAATNSRHDSFHLSTTATFLFAGEETGQMRDAQ